MKRTILSLATLLVMGTYSYAGEVTDDFEVTANVPSLVTVEAGDVEFGEYIGNELDTTGEIQLERSDKDMPVTVKLSAGGAGNFTSTRKMSSAAGDTLNYNLYTNNDRTTVWGDDSGGTKVTWAAGDDTEITYTVYGRILGGQYPPAGDYTDSITVTADY